MNRIRLFSADAVGEHGEEVGTVDRVVRKSVTLDGDRAEIEELPRLARAPEPHLLARGFACHRSERLADAELVHDATAVGADLQAGADFLEFRRLLVDIHVEAA